MPKGVLLTHMNFLSSFSGINSLGVSLSSDDIGISYLPMAHVMELAFHTNLLFAGAAVGFYGGNILKLVEDITILKPTCVPMVPRLLSKLYDGF